MKEENCVMFSILFAFFWNLKLFYLLRPQSVLQIKWNHVRSLEALPLDMFCNHRHTVILILWTNLLSLVEVGEVHYYLCSELISDLSRFSSCLWTFIHSDIWDDRCSFPEVPVMHTFRILRVYVGFQVSTGKYEKLPLPSCFTNSPRRNSFHL